MFIDHVHEMFGSAGAPDWLAWFGGPVGTIFFFLSVEGFTHTHDQKRYLLRLLIGFWVMQVGNQLVQDFFKVGNMTIANNIFCDIFIGVLTMYGLQLIAQGWQTRRPTKIGLGIGLILVPIILGIVFITAAGVAPWLSRGIYLAFPTIFTSENFWMLYIGPVMYLLRKHRNYQLLAIAAFALVSTNFQLAGLLTSNLLWMRVFAIIPIYLYNGRLGRGMKGFFYAFYPLHIWALYILASVLGVKG